MIRVSPVHGFACAGMLWLATSSAALAQVGVSAPPVPGPPGALCTNVELMRQVPCPDTELPFLEARAPIQRAYNAKDFRQLDALYDQWCTGKDRFPDGRWKLSEYPEAFTQTFSAWNTWTKDLATLQEWRKQKPDSEAAAYAEAIYWRTYAWKSRGSGYANTVSKEGWELFGERLAKARDALAASRAQGHRCPAPYAFDLFLMKEMGATESEVRAAYETAARKFSEYHNIHFAMSRVYEPKWGGSAEKFERFATEAAERTKSFEGMGMYARLYWTVDRRRDLPFLNKPGEAPHWKKLKAGYDDLMKRYPSSIHNLGKYAGVACRSDDSALYRSLRSKLDGHEHGAEMLEPVDVCDRRHQWVKGKP